MLGEAERRAVIDADRLERAAAAHQRLVVGEEHGLGRIDDAAAAHSHREETQRATASTGAPIAASSGRAFVHDSSISASGSESQTIPPPTQRWIRPSATANVRIVSASSRSPLPRTTPSAP